MKTWNTFINEIKEDVPVNSAGSGGSAAMGDVDVKSTGGIAAYDPILGTTARRKDPIDGRTKEFRSKIKQLSVAREKREVMKLEKKYGIKLNRGKQ